MHADDQTESGTARLGWYHLMFHVPEHWEVVAYRNRIRDGQIALSDRHGQAMRIFWKQVREAPPLKRRLVDVVSDYTDGSVSEREIRSRLRNEFKIEVGPGLGPMAGKIWRIGLMGTNARPEVVGRFADALEQCLSETPA